MEGLTAAGIARRKKRRLCLAPSHPQIPQIYRQGSGDPAPRRTFPGQREAVIWRSIIVIDKENAAKRKGIFMIDASRDFVKDGNKNRLRERGIYKTVTTFREQIEEEKYSRFVPVSEIRDKTDYNLNIPRYIDGGREDDVQNIEAHLKGGIPAADIDSLNKCWEIFPDLKQALFNRLRKGFYKPKISQR
jgi:type I restriction enzyme M protein